MKNVLLLCSYCDGDDDPVCTNELPCIDCLKMCNVFPLDDDCQMLHGEHDSGGGWKYQWDMAVIKYRQLAPEVIEALKIIGQAHINSDLKDDRLKGMAAQSCELLKRQQEHTQ